jgi:hypothetical protein
MWRLSDFVFDANHCTGHLKQDMMKNHAGLLSNLKGRLNSTIHKKQRFFAKKNNHL